MRYDQSPVIFLINNGGYTIEVEIHDGPAHNNYNVIKNWDYTAFAQAMHNGEGKLWTAKVCGDLGMGYLGGYLGGHQGVKRRGQGYLVEGTWA